MSSRGSWSRRTTPASTPRATPLSTPLATPLPTPRHSPPRQHSPTRAEMRSRPPGLGGSAPPGLGVSAPPGLGATNLSSWGSPPPGFGAIGNAPPGFSSAVPKAPPGLAGNFPGLGSAQASMNRTPPRPAPSSAMHSENYVPDEKVFHNFSVGSQMASVTSQMAPPAGWSKYTRELCPLFSL